MKFHFVTVLWGEEYTSLYLDLCLPTHLAPGNVPSVTLKADAVYKIYTTTADAERIVSHASFKSLVAQAPVDVVAVDHLFSTGGVTKSNPLMGMTWLHRMAVAEAASENAALVFLTPDMVWSDGFFNRLYELARMGKRAVMTTGFRTVKETFAPALRSAFGAGGVISAAPRQLVKLALEHAHPLMDTYFADSPNFSEAPVNLYFRVGQEGFVAHCLHLFPAMVWPRNLGALPVGAIDTDFLTAAVPDPADYHIVGDSDEMATFEVSGRGKEQGPIMPNRFSLSSFARFIARRGDRIHHHFLRQPIRIHHADMSNEWEAVGQNADKIIKQALGLKKWNRLFIPFAG
ncbi:MAG: hypothetical protein HY751_02405 [Nitrospinae bacterium]|nr:hypothetical protein [Nitrospinota bacterium]